MANEREPAHSVLLKQLQECLLGCQKGISLGGIDGLAMRHQNTILIDGFCQVLRGVVIPQKELASVKDKLSELIDTLLAEYENNPANITDATDELIYNAFRKTVLACDAADRKVE